MFNLSLLEILFLMLSGTMLGAVFFGGLWWTVSRLATAKRPGLLFMCSLFMRMIVLLVGVYYLGRENWQRFALLLLGVLLARFAVTRLTRLAQKENAERVIHHAP